MSEAETEQLRQDISVSLEQADSEAVASTLEEISNAQVADILESTPSAQRELIWPLIAKPDLGQVLLETGDEVRHKYLDQLESLEIAQIVESVKAPARTA